MAAGRTLVLFFAIAYTWAWLIFVPVVMFHRQPGLLDRPPATLAARGSIATSATSIQAGRLGSMEVRGAEVLLGAPLVMTKANIDQFDF